MMFVTSAIFLLLAIGAYNLGDKAFGFVMLFIAAIAFLVTLKLENFV